MAGQAFGVLKRGPDVRTAAKSGEPAMTSLRPTYSGERSASRRSWWRIRRRRDSNNDSGFDDARFAADARAPKPLLRPTAQPRPRLRSDSDVTGSGAPAADSRQLRRRQLQNGAAPNDKKADEQKKKDEKKNKDKKKK